MEETPPPPPTERRIQPTGESPFWSIISAVLFLYIGFGLGLTGVSDSPFYNGSVTVFAWLARIVGIGLLIVAGLAYTRLPFAAPLSFAMGLLATVGCLAIGAVWLFHGDGSGLLILLFGALNGNSTRSAWLAWQGR
jgi:hypothetical protein